jgi:hypothetical protein
MQKTGLTAFGVGLAQKVRKFCATFAPVFRHLLLIINQLVFLEKLSEKCAI